jgi:hypothetical protein
VSDDVGLPNGKVILPGVVGGRIHPQIAWAKLEALSQRAELATRRLWRSAA